MDSTQADLSPLVSVVIPSRNRRESALAAVRSALRQTYPAIEVIVVDDGSTPALDLPADLTEDRRVQLVRIDDSVGPGEARNIGVREASGSFIAFLDDDDTWYATKIERQVEALLAAGPRVAVSETGFDLWANERLAMRFVPDPSRNLTRLLLERPCLQPSTVLLRREAFESLHGFNPELRRIEDWELWVRLSERYESLALCEVLVDREESHPDPTELLYWTRVIVALLRHRIDSLPEAERDQVLATHGLTEAFLLARAGQRAAGCRAALSAWALRPLSLRPAITLTRILLGERWWGWARRGARATSALRGRALGRDPLVRSW